MDDDGCPRGYKLERGVSVFPSVGDPVQIPADDQLAGIIEPCREADRRVQVGTCPLAAHAPITIDPDKLFGRHLAVLGNTGSGKSCSVAGLIRWCVEEARKPMAERVNDRGVFANARFIIRDPNGEYVSAFPDLAVRVFQVSPALRAASSRPFVLPAWMWNTEEWCAFAQAAPQVQRPLLVRALAEARSGQPQAGGPERTASQVLHDHHAFSLASAEAGARAQQYWSVAGSCGKQRGALVTGLARLAVALEATQHPAAQQLAQLKEALQQHERDHQTDAKKAYYRPFAVSTLTEVAAGIGECLALLPAPVCRRAVSADAPVRFDIEAFPERLALVAAQKDSGHQGPSSLPPWGCASALCSTMRAAQRSSIPRRTPILPRG